jgi:hypothetical protein
MGPWEVSSLDPSQTFSHYGGTLSHYYPHGKQAPFTGAVHWSPLEYGPHVFPWWPCLQRSAQKHTEMTLSEVTQVTTEVALMLVYEL